MTNLYPTFIYFKKRLLTICTYLAPLCNFSPGAIEATVSAPTAVTGEGTEGEDAIATPSADSSAQRKTRPRKKRKFDAYKTSATEADTGAVLANAAAARVQEKKEAIARYVEYVKESANEESFVVQFLKDNAARVVPPRRKSSKPIAAVAETPFSVESGRGVSTKAIHGRDQFNAHSRHIQLRTIDELVQQTGCSQMNARAWIGANGGGQRSSISKWKAEEKAPKVDCRRSNTDFEDAVLRGLWERTVEDLASSSSLTTTRDMLEKIRTSFHTYNLIIMTATAVRLRTPFSEDPKLKKLKFSSHWVFNFMERQRCNVCGPHSDVKRWKRAPFNVSDAEAKSVENLETLAKLEEFAGLGSKSNIRDSMATAISAKDAFRLASFYHFDSHNYGLLRAPLEPSAAVASSSSSGDGDGGLRDRYEIDTNAGEAAVVQTAII